MKKLVYFFSLFFSLVSFSQNTRGKANDAGRIVLNTFIDEIEGEILYFSLDVSLLTRS